MKAAAWKKAVRPLMPPDEVWKFNRTLCYRSPVRRWVVGVLGESSGFSTGCYVWHVTTPLFLPSAALNLSFSRRVRAALLEPGETAFEKAVTEAFTAATRFDEGEEFERIAIEGEVLGGFRGLEAAACCRVYLSDETAVRLIDRATSEPVRHEWQSEVVGRLTSLREVLVREGGHAALRKLDEQATGSAERLGLVH